MFPFILPTARKTLNSTAEAAADLQRKFDRSAPDEVEFFPAKITSGSSGKHAWTMQTFDANGDREDHPNGRTGTTTSMPAVLLDGGTLETTLDSVPVWLRRAGSGSSTELARYDIVESPSAQFISNISNTVGFVFGVGITTSSVFTGSCKRKGPHLISGWVQSSGIATVTITVRNSSGIMWHAGQAFLATSGSYAFTAPQLYNFTHLMEGYTVPADIYVDLSINASSGGTILYGWQFAKL